MLNRTLHITLPTVPAHSKHLLNTSLSCYESDLVTLPLKLAMALHCLQDRVYFPKWSYVSESLTLSSSSWIWAELNILTSRDWPTSCWGGLASSPGFWNCSELGMQRWGLLCTGGEGVAFPGGGSPNPPLTPASSCGRPSSPAYGCLPDALCSGHPWGPWSPTSGTPPDSFHILKGALLCPHLGATSPSPQGA